MNPQTAKLLGATAGALLIGWAMGYTMRGPATTESLTNATPRASLASQTEISDSPPSREGSASGAAGRGAHDAGASFAEALLLPKGDRQAHDLYEIASRMGAGEIPGALEYALRLPRANRESLVPVLLRRWAELDPLAAAQYAFALQEDSYERYAGLNGALEAWALSDPKAVMAWVTQLPPSGRRAEAARALAGKLASADPAAALRFLTSIPGGMGDRGIYNILNPWMDADPAAAAAFVLAMPKDQSRVEAIRTIVYRWGQTQPQAALAWAQGIAEPIQREEAVNNALMAWSRTDPAAVIAHFRTMPEGSLKLRAIDGVIGSLDMDSARQLIELIPQNSWRASAMKNLVLSRAEYKPVEAAEYALTIPPGESRRSAIKGLVVGWTRQDPVAALTWAVSLEVSERGEAVGQTVQMWGRLDPRAALDYLQKNPSDRQAFTAWYPQLAAQWAKTDPTGALTWARALPEGNVRDDTLGQVIGTSVWSDYQQAARDLALISPGAQSGLAGTIATQMAANDPQKAVTWAAGLADGKARDAAYGGIAEAWADTDPTKAAQWLETLPVGSGRDQAVGYFAKKVTASDPAGAAAWAATISDERQRTESLNQVASQWLQSDKPAATAWIKSTSLLSESTKKGLIGW